MFPVARHVMWCDVMSFVLVPQTLPVQAEFWFICSAVRSGTGLPSDLGDGVLASTSPPPSQQRDQTTVYLQQASPLLQLEVYGAVGVAAHPHLGPAAHIRHRWVESTCRPKLMKKKKETFFFACICLRIWPLKKKVSVEEENVSGEERGGEGGGGGSRGRLINYLKKKRNR